MNASREAAAVDHSCQSIDVLVKNKAVSIEYLVETHFAGPGAWEKFGTAEEAEKAATGGNSRNAKVFYKNDLPARVDLELKSPSREWVHYVRYYFREDGTLQKTHSDFRRFGAYEKEKGMEQQFLVKVLRDRYFAATGKCFKKSGARCFNMSNMRELRDVVFTDGPWPIYAQTKALPFYGLLKPHDPLEKANP